MLFVPASDDIMLGSKCSSINADNNYFDEAVFVDILYCLHVLVSNSSVALFSLT